ncbi:MAG: hypothetical protein QXZ43_01435 [Candidatus Aenigmatarchaeota archaeon]
MGKNSWIATITFKTKKDFLNYSNNKVFSVLKIIVEEVLKNTQGNGIILFPAGWFYSNKKPKKLYEIFSKKIENYLKNFDREIVVCVGFDGRKNLKDQLGICITKKGVISIGRKFYPIKSEKDYLDSAPDHLSKEDNKSRIFKFNKKKYYISVCYDVFGIKKENVENPGVDAILNLVHEFKNNDSEANYLRHGCAGASNKWKVPVYVSVNFYKNSEVNFPSGIKWYKGKTYSKLCKYKSIKIEPKKEFEVKISQNVALVRIY